MVKDFRGEKLSAAKMARNCSVLASLKGTNGGGGSSKEDVLVSFGKGVMGKGAHVNTTHTLSDGLFASK